MSVRFNIDLPTLSAEERQFLFATIIVAAASLIFSGLAISPLGQAISLALSGATVILCGCIIQRLVKRMRELPKS